MQDFSDKLSRLSGVTLVMGGARSGKSRFAEQLALALDTQPLYIATAEARDGEMRERVALHQSDRDDRWTTLEEPLELATALDHHTTGRNTILVDCLTLWLSNVMEAERDIAAQTTALCESLQKADANIILVANEVGLGIVPANALARAYRDHAGRLNQQVGAVADNVISMTAGLPIIAKYQGRPTFLDIL